jgi:hypothetical protein
VKEEAGVEEEERVGGGRTEWRSCVEEGGDKGKVHWTISNLEGGNLVVAHPMAWCATAIFFLLFFEISARNRKLEEIHVSFSIFGNLKVV